MKRACLTMIAMILLAGCETMRPADEAYPWHGPLTDESGAVVPAPSYDEVP